MGLMLVKALSALTDGSNASVESRIIMVGLDGAGKTTTLYALKLGEVSATMPTVGFNVEQLTYRNITFNVWDMGGQHKLRRLWRHHYEGSRGIIFVVDSNDRDRIDEAAETLREVLDAPELANVPLLIFANKQDLPMRMTPQEVASKLGVSEVTKRAWNVVGTVASEGEGLTTGLDWLSRRISDAGSGKSAPSTASASDKSS